MIEIEIPKDVRKYESKLVGPFTTRQTICVAIAATLVIIIYHSIKGFLVKDVTYFICGLVAVPILMFGWYKPFGMKLEDFIKTAFISSVVSPKIRLYKTKNIYADVKNQKPVNKNKNRNKNTQKTKSSIRQYK